MTASILTISKLDSNLLLITPVPVQPIEVVRQVQQMFMVECQKVHDIQMSFRITQSYRDLNVDIVMLDSSRLLQVVSNREPQYFSLRVSQGVDPLSMLLSLTSFSPQLINMFTNAIKFTKAAPKPTIDVSIGAYLQPPPAEPSGFDYFPTKKARSNVTAEGDWGKGELLYLRFEV
jgi:hypothetical protein